MLNLHEIRNDLKEIRYYYSRKEFIDLATSIIGHNEVIDKVKKYHYAAQSLPPKLLDVYFNLYVRNYTQERLALELGYTPEYIQMQHKKLLLSLKSFFESENRATI